MLGTWQLALYHLGRLFSYTAIGLLFGILGRGFALFGWQQKISIAIGLLMVISVLFPLNKALQSGLTGPVYKAIAWVKGRLGKELGKRRMETFLLIGALNGLLPCGLVYLGVLGALATGNPMHGSLFMATFGLGTVPMMTAACYLGNFAGSCVRKRIRKLIPAVLVLMGLLFILRGMGLGIPYLSPAPIAHLSATIVECQP